LLEAIADYIQGVWHSTLPTRLAHAILVAVVFEVLILLTKRRMRNAFKRALAQDLHRDATMRVLRRRVVLGLPLLISETVLIIVALLIMLRYLGFAVGAEILPIALVLAVAAMVIFRSTLADMAAGYFILYDDLFSVGDRITVGDVTGEVVQMGLRRTVLLTNDRRQISLANGLLRQVTNHTRAAETEKAAQQ